MDSQKQVSYRHTPLETTLMYSCVKDRLQIFSETIPNKEACVVYDLDGTRSSITCSDLFKKACLFAKGLLKLGIKKGDIVAQSLPNGPQWMISTFGLQLAGAVPLMFMFYRNDGTDVMQALERAKCTAMLYDPGDNDKDWKISRNFIQNVDKYGNTSSEVSTLRYAFLSRKPENVSDVVTIDDILLLGDQNSEIHLPVLDPDDLALIFLTSGSSGTQKAVQYTHLNLIELGRHFCVAYDVKENDIYFNANSFNWAAAYPHIFLFKGTTRVSLSRVVSLKSVGEMNEMIMQAVSSEKCSIAMISVPNILTMIKNDDNGWASHLQTIIAAGAPIPSSCSNILQKFGKTFINIYGCTELGSVSASRLSKDDDNFENYNVGIPLPGMEMKIVNDKGEILPVGKTGELYVRHCLNHLGYHNEEELTNRVFTETGWYKTDDVGFMRENGTFVVSGRKSDIIIVGEELVSPPYLENIILKHPGVKDVVIVPIADDQMFQQPCACIIPKEDHHLTSEDLREFFREEFAIILAYRAFVPRYYLFFEEFPKTPLGKLSRKLVLHKAIEMLHKK